jgi:hypothetical protein
MIAVAVAVDQVGYAVKRGRTRVELYVTAHLKKLNQHTRESAREKLEA